MADTFKPGQPIRCTITAQPRAQGQVKTIARLMRRDAGVQRALRRAQKMRRQRMWTYIRGNRTWYAREKPARGLTVRKGESWSMVYTPDIALDLAAVRAFLAVEKT
ncbi:hypothetical protein FBT69_02330 [Synechococcales cyanobacterium CNB]|nr:hypothetical protein [Phycisphaerales bacterium]MDL1903633.1 hypothetical protein [Synechococcales cyanobacterium CNB]